MATIEEIKQGVDDYFSGRYQITQGRSIPDVNDIALGKVGTEVDFAMLFIDINESTLIVDGLRRITAARMYKAFLWGVTKIARYNGGQLRSFNGDGVLVVFYGNSKMTNAAKAALQMNWFVLYVLKPKIQSFINNNNPNNWTNFSCGIGIDAGTVLVVRGGIRGENNNDLVWVGNPTNYAVKLAKVSGKTTHISEKVYKGMADSSKYKNGDTTLENMWESKPWVEMNNQTIYGSSWYWPVPST